MHKCHCCVAQEIAQLREEFLKWVMSINQKLNVVGDNQLRMEQNMADRFDSIREDFDALKASASAISDAVSNVAADVQRLDDQIAALTAGQVTDDVIAGLKAQSSDLVSTFSALKDAADKVAAMTPEPEPPPTV